MFIKKMFIKFDENLDISCMCDYDNKKCPKEMNPLCEEYIVKFIKVKRSSHIQEKILNEVEGLNKTIKKHESELRKTIRKIKRFKI